MGLGELTGPLHYLQAREANREGTRALMETINLALGDDGLPTERLARNLEKWWPDLEEKLANIQSPVVDTNLLPDPISSVKQASQTKLRLFCGDGNPFRGEGVHKSDADLIYRLGVAAAQDTGVYGVKVVVAACTPQGLFQIGTPFRVMHEGPIFNLHAGDEKFPELLDAWVKQRDDVLVQPAHAIPVPKHEAEPGTYVVTVRATGEETSPCVKDFRLTVRNDRANPVTFESI